MKRRRFIRSAAAIALGLVSRASANDARAGIWFDFLGAYVGTDSEGATFVDYANVPRDAHAALLRYVTESQSVRVGTLDRAGQFAFWANLYNALTVKLVLDHYPVASIRDISISPGLFARGPWGRKLLRIEGTEVSLDDIEHRILRPGWRDARIHYVLNCASRGCPNLRCHPYTAHDIEAQLDAAARQFVGHTKCMRRAGDQLVVSSLFDWYAADFGGRRSIIGHIRAYAGPRTLSVIGGQTDYDAHAYDWSLNDKPAGKKLDGPRPFIGRPQTCDRDS